MNTRMDTKEDTREDSLWQQILVDRYNIAEEALFKFQKYALLLQNSSCNVTSISDEKAIILHHFADSLELGKVISLHKEVLIDVGTGGGFPGIPLKIAYPDSKMVLIEVTEKKRAFLKHVIAELKLTDITIEEADWRTFLRTTHYPAQYVCARASLQPRDLLRMMQPTSPYRNATLVYWASNMWMATEWEAPFVSSVHSYRIGDRTRKLVFFKAPEMM